MIQEISVAELAALPTPIFVDVRSEKEFAEATIPGAVNIPIFHDDERAQLGTIYRQVSPTAAKDLGLSLAAPKLPDMVRRYRKLEKQGSVVLFCWRGGMRSRAVATILDLMGLRAYRLVGGYKAYRHSVVEYWEEKPFNFGVVVLRGNTGTGKTELIQALKQHGRPAVDLEQLANNRGSVFGAVGLGTAPSQKKFEAELTAELQTFGSAHWIVVECESKRVGRVSLPNALFQAMQAGRQVLIFDTLENRVNRLVEEYTAFPDPGPELVEALDRLAPRLGNERVKFLNERLVAGDYHTFTRLLLVEYYDALYGYPNAADPDYSLSISMGDPAAALAQIEQFLDQLEAEAAK